MEVGADGTIYTLHGSEQLIRMFDPDGTLLGVVGGRGDGPGEFQSAASMGWIADTLWVMDIRGYRVSFFAPDGGYLSSFSVAFESNPDVFAVQPPRAAGLLFDGTVHGEPPAFSHQVADGTLTQRVPMLMTRDGRVTDTLPAMPFGRTQWAVTIDDRGGGSYRNQPYADGPLSAFATRERALVIVERQAPETAGNATFGVTKLTFAGDTLFSTRVAFEPRPVDPAEADSILDAVARNLSEIPVFALTAARARELAAATLYRPALRSGVTQLRVAKDGGIWLGGVPDGSGATEWLALDRDGRPLGRVTLPGKVNPLVIDPPFLWGSETDELEVPYVVRYRVETR
jgi:hypothetical protein